MATPKGFGGDADETKRSASRIGKGLAGDASAAVGGVADRGKGLAGGALGAAGGVAGRGKGLAGDALGAVGGVGSAGAGLASTSGKGGWRSYLPPNSRGKFPWKWRWMGVPLILLACTISGIWAWSHMEDQLDERALVHLACEGVDTSDLSLDWSYRSVTVDGTLPEGVTADQVERIIDDGSDNAECLNDAGIDADDNPGVYAVSAAGAALAAAAVIPDVPEPTVVPTAVPTPEPTATPEPEATATPEPEPTATPEPVPAAQLAATAAFNGQTVTLTGLVGSEAQRDQLVAAAVAAVGADNVIDELTIDPGDPTADSAERVDQLATLIANYGGTNLIDGTASVTEGDTTYAFNAPNDEARDALTLPGEGTVGVPMAPAAPSFTG